MGETTHQIEAHIEQTRDHLGSNLHELEERVKSVTDWKQHFYANPMMMVAVAFGGGVMLATMTGGAKKSSRTVATRAIEPHAGTEQQMHKALETWDLIKGAAIGLAANRFRDFVGDLVPGFQEEYRQTEAKARLREPSPSATR